MKDQKMSFKELKDEFKNTEGDPHVKQALRQRRMQMLQQSMMNNIPKADVIITNPIHIAVAIEYDNLVMEAPRVVAKGTELFAIKTANGIELSTYDELKEKKLNAMIDVMNEYKEVLKKLAEVTLGFPIRNCRISK